MRLIPAGMGRQAHHHRLGDDQAVRHVEVLGHALRVDNQAAHHEGGLIQRAGGVTKAFGQGDPLGVPGASGAFEIADQGIEDQPGMLA